jgi:hypothetical protein
MIFKLFLDFSDLLALSLIAIQGPNSKNLDSPRKIADLAANAGHFCAGSGGARSKMD